MEALEGMETHHRNLHHIKLMAPNHVSMNTGRGYVVPREEFQDGWEHQGYPLTSSGHSVDPRSTLLSTQIPSHYSTLLHVSTVKL